MTKWHSRRLLLYQAREMKNWKQDKQNERDNVMRKYEPSRSADFLSYDCRIQVLIIKISHEEFARENTPVEASCLAYVAILNGQNTTMLKKRKKRRRKKAREHEKPARYQRLWNGIKSERVESMKRPKKKKIEIKV